MLKVYLIAAQTKLTSISALAQRTVAGVCDKKKIKKMTDCLCFAATQKRNHETFLAFGGTSTSVFQ